MDSLRPGRGAAAAAALAAAAPPDVETTTPRGDAQNDARSRAQQGSRYVTTPRLREAGGPQKGAEVANASQNVGGATTAAFAGIPAAVRLLEQRLEVEKRHADRQIQRLEKRVEEVACASSAGGRWAELQGYVDGLAETVQDLVRSVDCAGHASPTLTEHAVANAMQPLLLRLDVVEGRQATMEEGFEKLRSSVTAGSHLVEFSVRLHEMEEQLEASGTKNRLAMSRLSGSSFANDGAERDMNIRHGHEGLAEQVEAFDDRLLRMERHFGETSASPRRKHLSAERRRECGASLASLDGFEDDASEDDSRVHEVCVQSQALEREIAGWTRYLQEQVTELHGKLQNVEHGLQDMAHAQEVREEVDHVGEQVMRLTMQRQRMSRGPGVLADDSRELRRELDEVGDELAELWHKAKDAECGLDGMATALDRVCGEVADLRVLVEEGGCIGSESEEEDEEEGTEPEVSGHGREPCGSSSGEGPEASSSMAVAAASEAAAAAGSAAASGAGAGAGVGDGGAAGRFPSRKAGGAAWRRARDSSSLWRKVSDMEKSLNVMAEIVWDVRRTMANVRKPPADFESAAAGEPGLALHALLAEHHDSASRGGGASAAQNSSGVEMLAR